MKEEKNSSTGYAKYVILVIVSGLLKTITLPDSDNIPLLIRENILYILLSIGIITLIYDLYKVKKELKRIENVDKKNLEDDNEKLQTELTQEKKRNSKPNHIHKRFESIIKKELNYIAIDYKPFFWLRDDAQKETPRGIGYELMSKIFEPFHVQLINETPSSGYSWKTIFDDFSNRRNKLDFIMTPMYETRSRLYEYDVIYSIPLFYSDIGVYVKRTEETDNLNFSFDEISTFLIEKREGSEQWKLEFMEGEISEIVGKKTMNGDLDEEDNRRKLSEDVSRTYRYKDFSEKLTNVSSRNRSNGDVIFMERFKAEKIIEKQELNLVNILAKNQLVYPVAFVIHKEETVFRNFINLRITELRLNGELQKVIKNNALLIGHSDEDKIFLQKYDFSLIDENFVEKRSRFSDKMRDEFDLLDKVYGNYNTFQLSIRETIQDFRKDDTLNILEIGFGSGITTAIIQQARKCEKKNFIAVDHDEFMRKQIEANTDVNSKKVTIKIIDVLKFLEESDDKSFDMVVSGYTIHNFTKQQREKLYKLLFDKMSENSIFINADKIAPDNDEERIEALKYRVNKYIDYLKRNPEKYPLIEEWVSHYINDQRDQIVMKEKDTINSLTDKGFKKENIKIEIPGGIDKREMMGVLTVMKKE